MPTLPGMDSDAYFGFTDALPEWRAAQLKPLPATQVASLLGKPLRRKRVPESPALLVKHARRLKAPELEASFELAAGLPEYMPDEMRADAWRQAARIAAGEAMETDEAERQREFDALARRAIRYAKRFGVGSGPVGPAVYGPMESAQPGDVLEGMAASLRALADKREQPTNVVVNVPETKVMVQAAQAPVVNMPAPVVNVKVPRAKPPVVNTQVNVAPAPVRVQAAKAPIVQPRITVRPAPVRVQAAKAPVVENYINVEPAKVVVRQAKQGPRKVVRDAKGDIVGTEPA